MEPTRPPENKRSAFRVLGRLYISYLLMILIKPLATMAAWVLQDSSSIIMYIILYILLIILIYINYIINYIYYIIIIFDGLCQRSSIQEYCVVLCINRGATGHQIRFGRNSASRANK